MLRIAGFAVSVALYGTAIVFATTPWRVHGGRFVTEYLLLGGAIGVVGLGLTAATLRWT